MLKKYYFYTQLLWLSVVFFLLSVSLFSCSDKTVAVQNEYVLNHESSKYLGYYPSLSEEKEVKNIILLIGDGMGFGQLTLARLSAAGKEGRLNMETFPVTGLMKNHSADALVTDSAASATAMACGIKTNNGMVGMDPYGKKYMSILEVAKEKSMSTGLIATSSITHATPACFGAHVENRDNETAIAKDIIENKINVLFGGGRTFFLPKKEGGKRRDGLNLIEEAEKEGYIYITTSKALSDVNEPYVLGFFQEEELTTDGDEPALSELTDKAIKILNKNKNGFFLMVEGSQIDWVSHDNDKKNTIKQTLEFDKAVKVSKDFAELDGQTLVIVTADHETGGLVIVGDEEGFKIKNKWTTTEHTAMPVPVYAFGPGAIIFTGNYDNTELANKMSYLLGINDFPRELDDHKDGHVSFLQISHHVAVVLKR
ncbi:MAG: alkaline phosphatase [Planctomycetota bacterium]|jgi:alkaline phosphatase